MKRILLTTTFLIAGAVGLLAQGKITFDNNPISYPDSDLYGGTADRYIYKSAGVLADDATWTVQLWQNGQAIGGKIPMYDGWAGVWDTAKDPDLVSGVPAAGGRTLLTGKNVATTLEVRVFDAAGALLGKSDPFAYTAPNSDTPSPSDLLMNNFRGFVVPEPSTVALGVLGLGALLLFRRRK